VASGTDHESLGLSRTESSRETGHGPWRLRRAVATNRRLVALSSLTFGSRVVARLAQLVFLVAAARLLTVEEFGTYSYLLVLAVTFSMLADTGVALAAGREISAGRSSASDAFWSAAPVACAGAACGAIAMLLFSVVAGGPDPSAELTLLAALFVAVNLVGSFAATMLRGLGRFAAEAGLQLAGAVAFLAAGISAAALGWGLSGVLIAMLGKELVFATASLLWLRPDVGTRSAGRAIGWRRFLGIGIKMGVASTGLAVATRSGLIILGNMGTASDVAWLSAPLRVADAVLVFALTAGYALLPGMSRLVVEDRARASRLIRHALLAAGGVALAAALIAVPIAGWLMATLFGPEFRAATEPARVLLAALPAYAALGVAWYAVLALDGERALMSLATLGAAASIAAGFAVIPGGGDVGAAWVYAATLTTLAVACLALLRRQLRERPSTPPGRVHAAA
jgi:O-antigen/teichoic acid export membrane protein